MNPLHAAAPLFMGLVAAEAAIAWRRGRRIHDLGDVTTDFGCAILCQFVNVFVSTLSVWAYGQLGASWRGAGLPAVPWWPTDSVLVWAGAILLVDFMQYVVHILNHRVAILWACHLVHHSSEELNLAVAIRTGVFSGLFNLVFMLPFSVLGLPWEMLGAAYAVNVAWQFWLHTTLVGRLGPLEAVLNTPSHHRVHHGSDPEYVDRNYAGILIVWDKFFGTYQEERHAPTYGVTPALASADPVWVNLYGLTQVYRAVRRAKTWRGRGAAIFGPPQWDQLAPEPVAAPRSRPGPLLLGYAGVQSLLLVVLTLRTLPNLGRLSLLEVALLTAVVGLTLSNIGGLIEGRPRAAALESARLVFVLAGAFAWSVLGAGAHQFWFLYGLASLGFLAVASSATRLGERGEAAPPRGGGREADATTWP